MGTRVPPTPLERQVLCAGVSTARGEADNDAGHVRMAGAGGTQSCGDAFQLWPVPVASEVRRTAFLTPTHIQGGKLASNFAVKITGDHALLINHFRDREGGRGRS